MAPMGQQGARLKAMAETERERRSGSAEALVRLLMHRTD
jgi:hypothetical protein